MRSHKAILKAVEEAGWAVTALAPEADLRSVVPLLRPQLAGYLDLFEVEKISPKTASQARPGTMSSIYGLGSFPLHTERAHWRIPPRYVIFRSAGEPTSRPTTLLDSHVLDSDPQLVQDLFHASWTVQWGDDRFLSSVLTPLPGSERWQIRYDRCCMTPLEGAPEDRGGRLEQRLDSLPLEDHSWQPGSVLLIDNWRMLHGRGTSTSEDFGRTLERIVIP